MQRKQYELHDARWIVTLSDIYDVDLNRTVPICHAQRHAMQRLLFHS